jgi:hypothetical protein
MSQACLVFCYTEAMKRTVLLIIGVALCILCGQDLIRILVNPSDQGIFGWLPGGVSAHIAADVAVIIFGLGLASRYSKSLNK